MNDEELFNASGKTTEPLQAELVRKYCGGLEAKLRAARTDEEARLITSEVCEQFDLDCESPLVRNFLRIYAETSFRQIRFGTGKQSGTTQ